MAVDYFKEMIFMKTVVIIVIAIIFVYIFIWALLCAACDNDDE